MATFLHGLAICSSFRVGDAQIMIILYPRFADGDGAVVWTCGTSCSAPIPDATLPAYCRGNIFEPAISDQDVPHHLLNTDVCCH